MEREFVFWSKAYCARGLAVQCSFAKNFLRHILHTGTRFVLQSCTGNSTCMLGRCRSHMLTAVFLLLQTWLLLTCTANMAFIDLYHNKHALKVHVIACRATRDPAAPIAISQYDPIFASPVGNFTPWQIHISPAGTTNRLITPL